MYFCLKFIILFIINIFITCFVLFTTWMQTDISNLVNILGKYSKYPLRDE